MQLSRISSLNVTGDVARLKHIPCVYEMRFHYVKTARRRERAQRRAPPLAHRPGRQPEDGNGLGVPPSDRSDPRYAAKRVRQTDRE